MESINTPELTSHYYLFIGVILFITLHSFDAVLCLMIVLDYMWKYLLFRFLLHLCFLFFLGGGGGGGGFCTEDVY